MLVDLHTHLETWHYTAPHSETSLFFLKVEKGHGCEVIQKRNRNWYDATFVMDEIAMKNSWIEKNLDEVVYLRGRMCTCLDDIL